MDVRNCKSCGKMFNFNGGEPFCESCRKKLEEKFQQVKEYVRENPGANMNTIAEEKEVSIAQIKRWVREERLVFSSDSPIGLECEKCGATIQTGRFCEKCKTGMHKRLDSAYEKKPSSSLDDVQLKSNGPARMRFLDR